MENRELDKWLAEKVMHWWLVHVKDMPSYWALPIKGEPKKGLPQCAQMCLAWQPTESDLDALQVVEKMLPDYTFNLYNGHPDKAWEASFMHRITDKEYVAGNKVRALAISLAAKAAIEGGLNNQKIQED